MLPILPCSASTASIGSASFSPEDPPPTTRYCPMFRLAMCRGIAYLYSRPQSAFMFSLVRFPLGHSETHSCRSSMSMSEICISHNGRNQFMAAW